MAKNLGNWLRDILYSIANIWGAGETANEFINDLIRKNGSIWNNEPTLSASELIKYVRSIIGNEPAKLTETINKIDAAINRLDSMSSNLPPSLSQNMRTIVRKARGEIAEKRNSLMKDRSLVSKNLSKVETTMNQGVTLSTSQDYLLPSRKEANQKQVREVMDSAPQTDYSSIERKLTDV